MKTTNQSMMPCLHPSLDSGFRDLQKCHHHGRIDHGASIRIMVVLVVPEIPCEDVNEPSPGLREKVRAKLAGLCTTSEYADVLEHELYLQRSSMRYRAAVIQILRNLEANSEHLLATYTAAGDLARLEPDLLGHGTESVRLRQMHAESERQMAKVLERGERGIDGLRSAAGLLRCSRCDSDDVHVELKQTRSADEGMTVFARCNKCQKRWRM